MTLREELEQLIRWEASASPLAQAIYESPDAPVPATEADYRTFLMKHSKGLHKAILRLADEIDALRERPWAE
jgi:hypothetical protein